MCHIFKYNINNALVGDPSRTTGIRLQFIRAVNKYFNVLKREIRISITRNDCFGIQPNVLYTLGAIPSKAFEFVRTPQKISGFMKWLAQQEKLGVLKRIPRAGFPGVEGSWADTFIDSAYAAGIRNGRAKLRKAGILPVADSGIGSIMNQPIHADRVGIIYSRTYEDLKSVTDVMNAQIRRKITDGLTTGLSRGIAEGKNPRVIARELYKDTANRVDKIGKVRARTIARTEVLNAHNEALMAEYERAQMITKKEIFLVVELGAKPCPICTDLKAGGPYPLHVGRGMFPAHPNCVCVLRPIIKE